VNPKEVTAMEMGLMMGGMPYSEISKAKAAAE